MAYLGGEKSLGVRKRPFACGLPLAILDGMDRNFSVWRQMALQLVKVACLLMIV